MNFFEHQHRARQQTSLLVFLFGGAVALMVFGIYLAVIGGMVWAQAPSGDAASSATPAVNVIWLGGWIPWNAGLFAIVTVGTLAIISGGSLYKTTVLASGGQSVAKTLGGRLIPADTRDLAEQRMLNVVEEMALASGTPVPPVYLLEQETGINAFAAGQSPSDAVIGVTRGCIEDLTRDELQGVVAHEFSHILNGDMRLNLRLMGWLHGILLIALIGSLLMRTGYFGHIGRASRASRKGNNYLPLIGLALYVLGYIGVFFGHLIKSSVSRQREFLADASAVQFTRNPSGIAGALARILSNAAGSRLKSPRAEEASHLLFGNGLPPSWLAAFSTHPPLETRIHQIDPGFSISEYLQRRGGAPAAAGDPPTAAGANALTGSGTGGLPPTAAAAMTSGLAQAAAPIGGQPASVDLAAPAGGTAERFIQSVGQPSPAHLQYAVDLRQRLPAALRDQLHTPAGAVAVVYCLLLDPDSSVRRKQIEYLRQHALPGAFQEAQRGWPAVRDTLPHSRLELIELALPALKQLSLPQYTSLLNHLDRLVEMDRRVTLNEYVLFTLIRLHLDRHFGRGRSPATDRPARRSSVRDATRALLSIMARAGQANTSQPTATEAAAQHIEAAAQHAEAAAEAAYRHAWQRSQGDAAPPRMLPAGDCTALRLDAALRRLESVSSAAKQRLLTACAASIVTDRQVTVDEAELLRLVSDHLDCPAPPLLPPG